MKRNIVPDDMFRELFTARYELLLSLDIRKKTYSVLNAEASTKEERLLLLKEKEGDYPSYLVDHILAHTSLTPLETAKLRQKLSLPDVLRRLEEIVRYSVNVSFVTDTARTIKKIDFSKRDENRLFFMVSDATLSILLLGGLVLLYTVLGGMKAVGKTNIMHMLVMYVGVIAALFVTLQTIGGFKVLSENLPKSFFRIDEIGWAKVSSWIIASVLGGCVAQAGLQPVLAAKDDKTAMRASYLTALIVAPFGLFTALLGMGARYLYPELANAKLALPTLLANMNPYLGGILIASILAAILSTASPIFLSCGTIFTRDIDEQRKKDRTEKEKMTISKLSILLAGIFCILLALSLYHLQKVLDIVYFAYALRGSMFVVLLLGIYGRRINAFFADVAMILTLGVGLFWVIWKTYRGSYPLSPYLTDTYACVIVAFLVTAIGTLFFPKKNRLALLTEKLLLPTE